MLITSSFSIRNADLAFNIESTFGVYNGNLASVTFSGSSLLNMDASVMSYADSQLHALTSIGGVIPAGYGVGSANLPSFFSTGEGGQFVPAESEYGEARLQGLYSIGFIKTSSPGDGDTYLPGLVSIGGSGAYGFGSVYLSKLISLGSAGPGRLTATYYESQVSTVSAQAILDHIVIINSTGQIVDSITSYREHIEQILSAIELSESYDLIGTLSVSISENLVSAFTSFAAVGDTSSLDTTSRVWVVNLDNKASSQYDDYGFNSFFEDAGVYYGISEDGIYELTGDTDNGVPISALIEIGKTNFGVTHKKHVPNAYLGISSTGNVYLKVDADGTSYTYEVRSSSTDLKNHRVDIGKGLRGTYFNFTLISDGEDFDLETISFEPVILSRKI